MDLDKIDTGLKKAEGILETISRIIKRFWWLLILGLIVWFFYWALTSEDIHDVEQYPGDQYNEESIY